MGARRRSAVTGQPAGVLQEAQELGHVTRKRVTADATEARVQVVSFANAPPVPVELGRQKQLGTSADDVGAVASEGDFDFRRGDDR